MFLRSLYPRLTAIAFLLLFSSNNLFTRGRVPSTNERVKATFRLDVIEEFFTQESAFFSKITVGTNGIYEKHTSYGRASNHLRRLIGRTFRLKVTYT